MENSEILKDNETLRSLDHDWVALFLGHIVKTFLSCVFVGRGVKETGGKRTGEGEKTR